MDLFSRQTLRILAKTRSETNLSLFMPTARYEANQEQNPIRYKNLLRQARKQLEIDGLPEEQVCRFLKPAQVLLDDTLYWQQASDGLAAFLTPDEARFYRLPVDFEELAVTGKRFHLKPLFPLIASNNRFYVLALSQNYVRLYQGTHYAISEVEAKEIPENILQSDLRFDDAEEQFQHHIADRVGGREDTAAHAQSTSPDDASHRPHDRLQRFFREVGRGVQRVLGDETAPLVLAGVAYYLPLYREVNDYSYLVGDDLVAGNPERLSPKQLHAKAWQVVEPLFLKAQQEAAGRFQQQMGHDGTLASTDLREIIPAAVFSRVDTLFVPVKRHRWGRYDADANAVVLHDEQEAGDEDLLNVAATHVYLNGGTVHALRPENMPVESDLAATFRYPADVAASEV